MTTPEQGVTSKVFLEPTSVRDVSLPTMRSRPVEASTGHLKRREFLALSGALAASGALALAVRHFAPTLAGTSAASTPEFPGIPAPFPTLPETQALLDANPDSRSLQVYMIENIDWDSIDWRAKRDHWDSVPLAGIELESRQMWTVAFNPIEIVSGLTFQVPERYCPSPAAGNYHPEFKDHVLEIWNNGQCGIATYPGCGYDPESLYIFAHQAFCVK